MTRFLLVLFAAACVFDPADQILRAKVPLFVLLWLVSIARALNGPDDAPLPRGLIFYVMAFIAIPLLSILRYYVINGSEPFDGFGLVKAYFFVSLTIVLVINRINLASTLSPMLSVLACCIIALFIAIMLQPGLFEELHPVGAASGTLMLDRRPYGEFNLLQVYFVTSPLLAISIAYFFDRTMSEPKWKTKLFFLSLTALNSAGMFLAGTRNNIFVSLLLPFFLWPLYTRRPALYALVSLGVAVILSVPFADYLEAFLDPQEGGNSIKIITLNDYWQMFSDPSTLAFGQGLGAYYSWSARPYSAVVELTYLEMMRNFGLVGSVVMLLLLLFPVAYVFRPGVSRQLRSLTVAYLLYLAMSASNPILFSSMGMLILSMLLANIFIDPESRPRFTARATT